MKLFTLLGVAGAVGPKWRELDVSYSFDMFKQDFGKSYSNAAEEIYRKSIFQEWLAKALAHNKNSSKSWKMAINQFSDKTQEEFRNSHGWKPNWGLKTAFVPAPELPANFKLEDLPTEIDWRTKNIVTPIKDQGMCGSCWAFASTEQLESSLAQATNALVALSPQNLVSCDPNPQHCGGTGGCGGSVPELAFEYVQQNGIATEAAWPYKSGTTQQDGKCFNITPSASVTGWVKLQENNYTQVMYTLANVGPVAVNVDAIPMQAYGGGLFTGCSQDSDTHIDHVVQLVGYGVDKDEGGNYWILRNSWGTTWGEAGYMKLFRHTTDYCGIDIYPSDGTGCTGGPSTVKVCGDCGVVYDVSYPVGAHKL